MLQRPLIWIICLAYSIKFLNYCNRTISVYWFKFSWINASNEIIYVIDLKTLSKLFKNQFIYEYPQLYPLFLNMSKLRNWSFNDPIFELCTYLANRIQQPIPKLLIHIITHLQYIHSQEHQVDDSNWETYHVRIF